MFCPSCGTSIPDGSTFCLNPGTKIVTVTAGKATSSASGQVKNPWSAGNVIAALIISGLAVGGIALALIAWRYLLR